MKRSPTRSDIRMQPRLSILKTYVVVLYSFLAQISFAISTNYESVLTTKVKLHYGTTIYYSVTSYIDRMRDATFGNIQLL